MTLDVKYQQAADNEVSHSNLFTVLNRHGQIEFQELGVMSNAKKALEKISQLGTVTSPSQ